MADELIALAPNVWLFPYDDDAEAGRVQPSVGIICGATQTVLVDAGNGPAHARRICAALHRVAAPPLALFHALGDDQLALCVPTLTFSQRLQLHVDALTIELQHVGGQHAPDSIVVGVPEAGVLFLGDCYYPPPVHLRTPESALDVAMLASLVSERYAWYVEGHNAPHSRAALRAALAQLDGGADG